MRPAGANDFLRWRRTIDEHLECRRLSWDEYGMFNWLCTKASPRTGTVRTSWPILAEQTGLSANHVEKLCRSLKQKRYVWYPLHRGRRVGLVEVAIHKYPIAGDTYTDLTAHFAEPPTGGRAEMPADFPAEFSADIPAEGTSETREGAETCEPGRQRRRERTRHEDSLRVRTVDPDSPADAIPLSEALAQAPVALRETIEFYGFKTGRDTLSATDLEWLRQLEAAHTPAVIQKAISTALARFARRGQAPRALSLEYVGRSLQHYRTRKPPTPARVSAAPPAYPSGVTRLWYGPQRTTTEWPQCCRPRRCLDAARPAMGG